MRPSSAELGVRPNSEKNTNIPEWTVRGRYMTNNRSILRCCFSGLAFILFNRKRSLLFCVAFVLASYFVEIKYCVPAFFSCSGAIVSIAGIFLNIKHSLNFHLNIPMVGLYNKLAGAGIFGTSNINSEQEKWVSDILADEMYGVSFMVVGTIIWAYGSYFVAAMK